MPTTGFAPLAQADFRQILTETYNAKANLPANDDEGSTLGAIFDADSLQALQLEMLLVAVQSVARLVDSSGGDVDSFVAPFGVSRLGASASSGGVLFTLSAPASQQYVIPAAAVNTQSVAAIVQTANGLRFQAVPDTSNLAYSATAGGYVIGSGAQSVTVTVQCLTPGTIGNVQAGQVNLLAGSGTQNLPIATVGNAAAFANAIDEESDPALIARFTIAVSSGRVATPNALAAAVLGVQPNLTYSIGDNLNGAGAVAPGIVTVVVNVAGQNAGPTSTLVNAVQAAVNAARSAGITVNVIAPTLVTVSIAATLHVPAGANQNAIQQAAVAAASALVNGIGLDPAGASTTCSLFDVAAALKVAGVTRITGVTLNSGTADITAAFAHQLVINTVTLTISSP
jgi:hypothetical protein